MFGIDFIELIIILVVALIVFGPEKLPEIARQLGKISANIKRTSNALRREFYNELYPPAEDFRRDFREASKVIDSVSSELKSTVIPGPAPSLAPPSTSEVTSAPQKEKSDGH